MSRLKNTQKQSMDIFLWWKIYTELYLYMIASCQQHQMHIIQQFFFPP